MSTENHEAPTKTGLIILAVIVIALLFFVVALRSYEGYVSAAENRNTPIYTLKEDGQYGYEGTDGQIVFLIYFGERQGVYQFAIEAKPQTQIYEISPPYEFYKIHHIFSGEYFQSTTMRMDLNTIIGAAFTDARNNQLVPHTQKYEGIEGMVWMNDNYEIAYSPLKPTITP